MGRKGFTLTELLVVVSILAIMSVILVGIINPIALVNRGKDARRKKDLARIKTAFEEYYNDKGCYPDQSKVDELNGITSCGSMVVFAPWLAPWSCDPDGDPYEVVVAPSIGVAAGVCPNVFRAYTTLDFAADRDIPDGWGVTARADMYTSSPVNYGVSSLNVNWYENTEYPAICTINFDGVCHWVNPGPGLSAVTSCTGSNCYWSNDLSCQTDCCVQGERRCPP